MKVLKFGGSVLKNSQDVENIANILKNSAKKNDFIVAVVSAFYGITSELAELVKIASSDKDYKKQFEKIYDFHRKLAKDLNIESKKDEIERLFTNLDHLLITIKDAKKYNNEVLDYILSFGERLSSFVMASFLEQSFHVQYIEAQNVIKTDSNFGYARVDFQKTENLIKENIKNIKGSIVVCGGFIGSDNENRITTLGRNGSDYTASIMASALNADCVEIWKDTDGLCTADPKLVENVKFIKEISYQEMAELSSLGNKVIHINAIFPCITKNIPIFLKNCYNEKCVGTKISADKNKKCEINGVVKLDNVVVLKIKMNEFADIKSIAMKTQKIIQSFESSIITVSQNIKQKVYSIIVAYDTLENILRDINEELERFITNEDMSVSVGGKKSMISVIGTDLSNAVGISGKMFDTMQKNNILIDSIHDDFSETRISFLCNVEDANNAVKLLHKKMVG